MGVGGDGATITACLERSHYKGEVDYEENGAAPLLAELPAEVDEQVHDCREGRGGGQAAQPSGCHAGPGPDRHQHGCGKGSFTRRQSNSQEQRELPWSCSCMRTALVAWASCRHARTSRAPPSPARDCLRRRCGGAAYLRIAAGLCWCPTGRPGSRRAAGAPRRRGARIALHAGEGAAWASAAAAL